MSKDRPYHIRSKATTIATYWLLQWVGLIVLVAVITALFSHWTFLVYDIVTFVIMGTVFAGIIMCAQAAYVAAPDMVGGSREIGRFRLAISITAAAAGVTGLCSLVLWLLIAAMGALLASANATGPLMMAGLAGMIMMFVLWSIQIGTFVRKGRREERFMTLTMRMLAGTCLSAMACVGIGFIATLVAADTQVFLVVVMFCSPWLIGAVITLLGCRLYLKRLWIVRAPWYETHCAECGYDLSGNLAVTQCSECGTPWTHAAIVPADSRRAEGKCDGCGYDMSGTPNAERCPECGTGWRNGDVLGDGGA